MPTWKLLRPDSIEPSRPVLGVPDSHFLPADDARVFPLEVVLRGIRVLVHLLYRLAVS